MGIAVPVAGGVQAPQRHRGAVLGAGIAGTCAAMALAAAVAAGGSAEHATAVAAGRALVVGVPCAVGLYAWWRRPGDRFGLLLVAAGLTWLVATLAESPDPGPYTVGRIAGWVSEALLVYLILAFPTGRLPGRADRRIVGAVVAVIVVAYLPRLVVAEDFPVPAPVTSCARDCPANALFVLGHEPGFVDAWLQPAGTLLLLAVMVAVLVRLWGRIVASTPLARRMFIPVLAIAAARTALMAAGLVVRGVDPGAPGLEALVWLLALAVPAIALAFLAGLIRWRLFAAEALERLAFGLRVAPDGVSLRRAFAEAFDDPSIEIAFPAGRPSGGWVDARGRPVVLPRSGSGRAASVVRDGDRDVAMLVHDEALRFEPELVRAGTAIAGAALGNRRLAAEARAAMVEARRSRARIAATAERERRRIERDLHDGAQQRLVALRIELQLAEDLVERDPRRGVDRLRELEHEVDEAIEELRALAHGVYPPLLADRGLEEALRAAARHCAVPVAITARHVGRHPAEVESAVYFCVLEALQNVVKHAGAGRADVVLDGEAGDLRFSVRDDGAGLPAGAARDGQGLANMRDRVAAVGGALDIASAPGGGAVVRGRIPPTHHEEIP